MAGAAFQENEDAGLGTWRLSRRGHGLHFEQARQAQAADEAARSDAQGVAASDAVTGWSRTTEWHPHESFPFRSDSTFLLP
jgi:hypothetical protein